MLGNDGWAVDFAEKQRISEFASIGLYWFSSGKKYIAAYQSYFINPENLVNGERYIAPLYRQLLKDGDKISISNLDIKDVHVLGTPAELNEFNKLNTNLL